MWLISRFRVEHLGGPLDYFAQGARQCPSCTHPLPYNIERVKNYIVALVGLTGSGKTSYIAVGIQELMSASVAQALDNAVVLPASDDVETRYRHTYHDPVYDLNAPLPSATLPGQKYDPLIYILRRPGRRDVNLLFYDVSGEDFATAEAMRAYGRFALYAHAFIVLEDPLVIDEVAQKTLPGEGLDPKTQPLVEGKEVLNYLTQAYQMLHNTRKPIPVPTAIALSKSDILKFTQAHGQYTFFKQPPYTTPYNPTVERNDLDVVDQDVQIFLSNLQNNAGQRWLTWRDYFKNVHYFAISATGTPVNYLTNKRGGPIQPMRVLDPLLWVLSQLKVVSAK